MDEINVLTALQVKESLFESLEEVLGTPKRKRAFIELQPGDSQTEVGEKTGISQSTVSRTLSELEDKGLIEEVEDGYKKNLTCMDHPLLKHLWEKEVLEKDD